MKILGRKWIWNWKKRLLCSQSLVLHSLDDLSEFAKYLISLDWFTEFLTHKAEYSTVHKNCPGK